MVFGSYTNSVLLFSINGSGTGIADIKDLVYGCSGYRNSSSVSAISMTRPL